ncbi:AbiH family protein [Flavobacterium sp.]|uniref:AbiH family protein n=1 Tax=Flavobacterium sp. TaxID=239 RepID=UPI00286A7DC9|nr:AbiH family protein [Flavobacterium sp.]
MNRLVIIGNGFDLAHGLPTGYRHFIDDFWKNFKEKHDTEDYKKLIYSNELYNKYYTDYGPINSFKDFLKSINSNIDEYPEFRLDSKSLIYYGSEGRDFRRVKIFEFKNSFFKQICTEDLENWVDIETEYYKALLTISTNPNTNNKEKINKVKTLNNEFALIKKLLHDYLEKEVCKKYEFKIDDTNEVLNYLISEIDSIDSASIQSYSTLFLSFNYTPTARVYSDFLKSKLYNSNVNYIHGEIGNPDNPEIIFGYGDDKDENYKLIKNLNDNAFLENIKPFEYNNNDNFENLRDFLNQSKYNVYLIGHSCGLSDKYLLNQIFENDNCNSIKVLYRVYDDGLDDFRNKPRDISRHFDDDRLATIRIINKKKSRNIPQDIRFKERSTNDDHELLIL